MHPGPVRRETLCSTRMQTALYRSYADTMFFVVARHNIYFVYNFICHGGAYHGVEYHELDICKYLRYSQPREVP